MPVSFIFSELFSTGLGYTHPPSGEGHISNQPILHFWVGRDIIAFGLDPVCVSFFVLLEVLRPSQQLWSCRNGQFTLPHFFLGKLDQAFNQYFVHGDILSLVTDKSPS